MEAQVSVGFNVFCENYTSAVTMENHHNYKKVVALAKNTQLFHFLRNEWFLQPVVSQTVLEKLKQEGKLNQPEDLAQIESCWVSLRIDFAFRSALYSQASSMFLDQVARRMAKAFATRCQYRYKQALRSGELRKKYAEDFHRLVDPRHPTHGTSESLSPSGTIHFTPPTLSGISMNDRSLHRNDDMHNTYDDEDTGSNKQRRRYGLITRIWEVVKSIVRYFLYWFRGKVSENSSGATPSFRDNDTSTEDNSGISTQQQPQSTGGNEPQHSGTRKLVKRPKIPNTYSWW